MWREWDREARIESLGLGRRQVLHEFGDERQVERAVARNASSALRAPSLHSLTRPTKSGNSNSRVAAVVEDRGERAGTLRWLSRPSRTCQSSRFKRRVAVGAARARKAKGRPYRNQKTGSVRWRSGGRGLA